MTRDLLILTVFVLFGGALIYWLYSRHETSVELAAQQQYAQTQLNPKPGGNVVGNGLKSADNLATGVCPAVAKGVASAYGAGAIAGAAGGVLPTLCKYSRYVDPVHYVAQGLGSLINKL